MIWPISHTALADHIKDFSDNSTITHNKCVFCDKLQVINMANDFNINMYSQSRGVNNLNMHRNGKTLDSILWHESTKRAIAIQQKCVKNERSTGGCDDTQSEKTVCVRCCVLHLLVQLICF